MPSPRYGIAEWYGRDILSLSPAERETYAEMSLGQSPAPNVYAENDHATPLCPFLSSLKPGAPCNKPGGVCSIRRYRQTEDGQGEPVEGEAVATLCPNRFLEPTIQSTSLFVWIAEMMLDVDNPIVVKETPFLRNTTDTPANPMEESTKAGRIDWLLVNASTLETGDPKWCAVETQALYFSGNKMSWEFEGYANAPFQVLFPVKTRRPDYRSSGPKRLAPQLDVKVPVLRAWGKKVAVVVDRYFYESMNTLQDAYPRATTHQERRDNADIAWFVVDYDDEMHLRPHEVIFTTLERSREALNATEPLSKSDFNNSLRNVINDNSRTGKVFRVSI